MNGKDKCLKEMNATFHSKDLSNSLDEECFCLEDDLIKSIQYIDTKYRLKLQIYSL
jgi:hypothetical protein